MNRNVSKKLNLKRATILDHDFFSEVRNEKTTRKLSFDSKPLNYSRHKEWFEKSLENNNRYLFVICFGEEKVGTTRVDINNSEGEISLALLPEYRGKGLGTKSLKYLVKLLFYEKKLVDRLVAKIKMDNQVSIKTFEKVGFEKNNFKFKGITCLLMTLEKFSL